MGDIPCQLGPGNSGMQKTDGARGKKEKSSAWTEFSYHTRFITYTGILSVIVFRRYQRQQPIKGLRMASQSILNRKKIPGSTRRHRSRRGAEKAHHLPRCRPLCSTLFTVDNANGSSECLERRLTVRSSRLGRRGERYSTDGGLEAGDKKIG